LNDLMGSGHVQKCLRNPDLHPNQLVHRKDFSMLWVTVDFFRWWPKAFFQWSQQWLNIILPTRNYSKIKKLFKFQIYGSKAPSTPLQTPMQTKIIMFTYCKLRSSGNKLTRSFHKLKLCNRSPEFRLNHLTVFGLGSS